VRAGVATEEEGGNRSCTYCNFCNGKTGSPRLHGVDRTQWVYRLRDRYQKARMECTPVLVSAAPWEAVAKGCRGPMVAGAAK
jgi:hypothetical protein